jgi:hypothetical protein
MINIANPNTEELKVQLKAFARDNLGITLQANMLPENMIQKIRDTCGEKGVNEPFFEQTAVPGIEQTDAADLPKAGTVRIVIAKTDKKDGAEPAFVGFQGIGYTIPRAVECDVPRGVVGILGDAKQDIITQDEDTNELLSETVQTYPFEIRATGPLTDLEKKKKKERDAWLEKHRQEVA